MVASSVAPDVAAQRLSRMLGNHCRSATRSKFDATMLLAVHVGRGIPAEAFISSKHAGAAVAAGGPSAFVRHHDPTTERLVERDQVGGDGGITAG